MVEALEATVEAEEVEAIVAEGEEAANLLQMYLTQTKVQQQQALIIHELELAAIHLETITTQLVQEEI